RSSSSLNCTYANPRENRWSAESRMLFRQPSRRASLPSPPDTHETAGQERLLMGQAGSGPDLHVRGHSADFPLQELEDIQCRAQVEAALVKEHAITGLYLPWHNLGAPVQFHGRIILYING